MDFKKFLGTLVILVLVITVFGCKKEAKPSYPEEVAAPAKDVRETTMEAPEDVLSWGRSTLRVVSDLKCDLQGDKGIFSFKLINPTENTYLLKTVSSLDTVSNPIKVKVNGRLFDYSYCRDGTGDVTVFGPGQARICTREFAATEVTTGDFIIRTGLTKLGTPVENRLFIMSGDFTSEVLFKCD